MIDYSTIKEKFLDKGYILELHWFVLPPPTFVLGKTIGTQKEQKIFYEKAVQKVYGKEWDYWNTWIDYQKHK